MAAGSGMTQGRSGKTTHRKGKATTGTRHRKNSKRNQLVLMRWIAVIVVLVAVVIVCVRCAGGNQGTAAKETVIVDETVSRVEFTRKGALTVTSVETFDKDYYDQAELQEAIDSAVTSYNDSNDGGVTAGDLTVENGTATLVMQYDSADDYESFNNQEMFWGTLQAAEDAGYDLSGLSGQTNAQDETQTFGEGTARSLADNTLIVITESLNVLTPSDILYASENLTIANSDYAVVNGDISESMPAILILK